MGIRVICRCKSILHTRGWFFNEKICASLGRVQTLHTAPLWQEEHVLLLLKALEEEDKDWGRPQQQHLPHASACLFADRTFGINTRLRLEVCLQAGVGVSNLS
jgi:hypothetical protein